MSRTGARRAIWTALLLGALIPAYAQKGRRTTFAPALSLGYGVTNNLAFVDEAGQSTSDSAMTLGVLLPVQKQARKGNYRLNYRATGTQYQTASALDNIEHFLDLAADWTLSRASSLRVTLFGEKTQRVADIGNVRDDNVFIEQRTSRVSYGAGAGYSHNVGNRWSLSADVAASESTSEAIQLDSGGETGGGAKDYSSYLAALGLSRRLSSRTTFRMRYGLRHFDSATGGEADLEAPSRVQEDVHVLDLQYDRTLNRRSNIGLRGGAYQRSRDDETDLVTQGAVFSFSYGYGPIAKTRLGVGLGLAPSSGGNLGGTSTNAAFTVNISGVDTRRVNWRVAGGFTRRVSSVSTDPTVDTISGLVFVEPLIGRGRDVGIRFNARWARQASDVEGFADGEFVTLGAGLVWYPLARTRLSGSSGT